MCPTVEWNEELIDQINKDKVLNGANKLKCRKTVGLQRLPMEIFKVLREN